MLCFRAELEPRRRAQLMPLVGGTLASFLTLSE